MKIKKVLATTLATVMTSTSICSNVFAFNISSSDTMELSIIGHSITELMTAENTNSKLLLPGEKDSSVSSYLAMDKGYSAIWSNYNSITKDDLLKICSFYNSDGSKIADSDVKLKFKPVALTGSTCIDIPNSKLNALADFICVEFGGGYYYIPIVAAFDGDEDDVYNWYYDTSVQKPKRIYMTKQGTPDYYINYQYSGGDFSKYKDYQFCVDFYDENEIYFKNTSEKNQQFKQESNITCSGDFYTHLTDTDGDFHFFDGYLEKEMLGCCIEDESLTVYDHIVPILKSENTDDVLTFDLKGVSGIKIAKQPNKLNYIEGQVFDPSGMVITLNNYPYEITSYSYDTKKLKQEDEYVYITANIYASERYESGQNSASPSVKVFVKQPVTVTKKAVSKLEITKLPNKVDYVEGEMLNLDGAEFKVTYNDGTSEIINNKLLDINYSTGNALTTNDTTINVSYGDGSVNIPITVVSKQITSIKVIHQPDKINYVAGQAYDLTGIVVEATYNDGTTALINDYDYTPDMYLGSHIGESLIGDINKDGVIDKVDAALALKIGAGISISDIDVDLVAADCNRDGIVDSIDSVWILRYRPGMAFINITKDGKGDYFYVNVSDRAIKSISVKKKPDKVDYLEGEKFEPAGMIIEATYNDGTTEVINDYKIENDVVTSNMENVYITAGDLYTTVPISVSSKSIAKLEVVHQPVKTSYVEGENFDRTGMVVKAIYNDGSSAIIDNYTVTPTTLTLNDKEVTVALNGVKTTVPVTVVKKEITGIKITKLPDKVDYLEGETFNPDGMEITVTYNDNTTSVITNGYNYSKDKLKAGDKFVTIIYGGYTDNVNIILTMSDLSSLVPEKNGDLNRDGSLTAEDAIILQKILGNVVGYGYKATHTGDVDNNGSLTADDATIIKNYLNGNIKLSDDALINADIDGDGAVTAYDAALVEKAVMGMWSLDTVYALNADANDDGNVNMLDVIWILNTHYKHTTIDHISIVKAPNKVDYVEGQVFDPAGMIIEAVYKDGTVEEITDYLYPVRPLTAKDTKITISCDGNNAEQEINVYKKAIAGSDDDKYPTVSTTEATTEVTTSNTDISESTTSEDNSTESTETTTEITTAESTETTTTKHSSGAGMHRPMTATTTETTTEATTEKTTVEESTEATTNSMFADVVDHWAKDYIEHLHLNGIVNGVTDDLFAPNDSTKRGDFALVLCRMLNLNVDTVADYSDVDKDSYYSKAISAVTKENLMIGYGDGTFKPEQAITREEMMVIIAKLAKNNNIIDYNFESLDYSELNEYNDGELVSWWAKPYVCALSQAGIVVGNNCNLKPKDNITRAEMSVIIDNYISK